MSTIWEFDKPLILFLIYLSRKSADSLGKAIRRLGCPNRTGTSSRGKRGGVVLLAGAFLLFTEMIGANKMKLSRSVAPVIFGVLALLLALPIYGAGTNPKPKYRLHVAISGLPSKIVLNQPYTYTIKITNTGRLKLKKVTVRYWDGTYVPKEAPLPSGFKRMAAPGGAAQEIRGTLTNVRAGTTRKITFSVVYTATHGKYDKVYVIVTGSSGGRDEATKYPNY